MEFHPASLIFPDLSHDEYAGLLASVRENGVLSPVKVDDQGRIVDGRHRAWAAGEAGIECPVEPLPEGVDAWTYARTINLDRRNLPPQQRAAILLVAEREGLAPEVTKIREEAVPGNPAARGHIEKGQAAERIGSLVGVGKTTVKEVEAAARLDPDSLEKIARGETTASQVRKQADARLRGQVEDAFFPATVPVFEAWWKATTIVMQKVLLNDLAEEWGPEERQKIIEWTPRLVERLRAVEQRATETPVLAVVNGGG